MFQVISVKPENYNVITITLQGNLSEAFQQRQAGQFALLEIPGSGERPHPFTLSGAPEDAELLMTIKRVGEYTARVHQLTPGAQVNCQGPYGKFCSNINLQPVITMVAGGIGITPFLSVLRHFIHQNSRQQVELLWANNTEADFFGLEELKIMTEQLSLKVSLVSLEGYTNYNQKAMGERIQLEAGYLTPQILPKGIKDSAVYLCGSPAMQDYVLTQLAEGGVDLDRVEKEKITG